MTAGRRAGGTKRRRKVLRDDTQGITKPAIRRLARRGGVKRISGLVYEATSECTAAECTGIAVRRMRSLSGALPTGSNVVVVFSHHYGTATLDSPAAVAGLADVIARMHPVKDTMTPPAPGILRMYHDSMVCEGPTYGDGVAVLFPRGGNTCIQREGQVQQDVSEG